MSLGSEAPSKRWYSRITTWPALKVRPLSNDRSPSPLTPKCSMNPHLASSSIVFARVPYPAFLTSLAPEGQHPVGTGVRLVRHDDESPLASAIATGARPRLNRIGCPLPVGYVIHPDQGPIERIVQMVRPFMATEALVEDTVIHALDPRRSDRARLLPFGPLLVLRRTA